MTVKKRYFFLLIVFFFPPGHALAYFPDDPNFICAEPYDPHNPNQENDSYQEDKWLYDEMFDFYSFAPYFSKSTALYYDPDRFFQPQVSGSSIDLAWDISKGDSSIVIAIIDTGVDWGDTEIVERLFLNKGELKGEKSPDPERPGVWDVNGDGTFNIMDYELHPDFGDLNKNGIFDPQDLLLNPKFADNNDNDDNGFIDDICGWDFFEDDNDPEDTSSYAAANFHGRGQMETAAGQQNAALQQEEAKGGCGVCPECMVLPIKDWDSFLVNADYFGYSVLYATMVGAHVIEGAIGGLNNSGICKYAFKYAYDKGLTLFLVSSDINSANHNYPTYLNEPIYCSGIVPDTFPIPNIPPTTYFRDSNLTQYGAKNHISFEVSTGSQATAMASGAGGLILSQSKSMGIPMHPDQVKQLLTLTAEDVLPQNLGFIGKSDPAKEGWDQHFGYGRVNMFDALDTLRKNKIPPVARITSPSWFAYMNPEKDLFSISGDILPSEGDKNITWILEAGYGIEPDTFKILDIGTTSGKEIKISDIDLDLIKEIFPKDVDLSSYPSFPDPLDPGDADIQPNRHLFTIRLRATGHPSKNKAEDRRTFFLHEDKTLHKGWPIYIGVGGEGAVRFADLDGDNNKEVVIPTSDGRILIFTHDGKPFIYNGQKVSITLERSWMAEKHNLEVPGQVLRSGIASIAVGDIDNDGIKEIVGVSESSLFCFKATGQKQFASIDFSNNLLLDLSEGKVNFDNHIGPSAFAAPVLFDIDKDGDLEIFLGASDQRVYAWHHDGSPVDGWPVYVRTGTPGARITHSPCIADINGDGTYEIIVATNAVHEKKTSDSQKGVFNAWQDDTALNDIPKMLLPFVLEFINNLIGGDCMVYAIHADGTLYDNDQDGQGGREVDDDAFLEGWPVRVRALLPDILPFVGPSTKPCAYDFDNDGRDEIVASFTSSKTSIIDGTGKIVQEMDQGPAGKNATGIKGNSPISLNLFDSPAIGDINGDGKPEIAQGGLTLSGALNLLIAGQNFPFNHTIQAWNPLNGNFLDAFPRTIDDHVIYAEPCIADVSGDGIPEIIAGSGMYLIHAFGDDGMDKPGFPKLSGGWIMTTPAVDDIDNDGENELAVITREGWIFIWDTPGTPAASEAWPTYGHDNFNTSNLSFDATPPASVTKMTITGNEIGFICPGDDGFRGTAEVMDIYGSNTPIYVDTIKDAVLLKTVKPARGGTAMNVTLDKDYLYIGVIAVDDEGNRSQLPLTKDMVSEPDMVIPAGNNTGNTPGPQNKEDSGFCFIDIISTI